MTDKTLKKINELAFFSSEMAKLRVVFPEFAREIDKCVFDVGQNNLGSCGHTNCDCQMSFEKFHAQRNRVFNTETKKTNYEFN